MRRRRNPMGSELTDVAIIGGIGVAAFLIYRFFYPSQNDTLPSGAGSPSGSTSDVTVTFPGDNDPNFAGM